MEGTTNCGTNMVRLMIVVGRKKWFVYGTYGLPNKQSTVNQANQDLLRFPDGTELLIVGEINAHLAQPFNQCKEYLVTAITNHGLED